MPQTHAILPQPNNLPTSYSALCTVLKSEMIQVQQAHMCPKNCVIYVGEHSQDEACPKCNCPRYKPLDSLGRRAAAKYFSYCSLKDSLDLLFKCSNIAQIIQEAGGCSRLLLSDIQDTDTFNDIAKEEGVLVMLGLNTDGVISVSRTEQATLILASHIHYF